MDYALHFEASSTIPNALKLIRTGNCYSAVFCTLRIGSINGMELLRRVKSEFPQLPVVIVTEPQGLRSAVLASIAGASDFIQTPLDPAKIRASLDRAIIRKRIEAAWLASERA